MAQKCGYKMGRGYNSDKVTNSAVTVVIRVGSNRKIPNLEPPQCVFPPHLIAGNSGKISTYAAGNSGKFPNYQQKSAVGL